VTSFEQLDLPFTRKNWAIFAVGLATIVVGYLLLSIPPADGFFSLTLAPILLILGYCVLIPVAILKKDRPPAKISD
jgi:hypothetical protein